MYNLLEYSLNYSNTKGSLWFYSKDETTDFDNDIVNTNDFKSFKYRAKSLGKPDASGGNGILRNTTIAVPLTYPSNFYRLLKIPLINCKVPRIVQSTKDSVLFAADANNANAYSNDFIVTIRDTKYLSKTTKNYQKFLAKGLKDQCIRMN